MSLRQSSIHYRTPLPNVGLCISISFMNWPNQTRILGSCHEQDTLVVAWDGPDDPQDPYNRPLRKKLWAVGLGLFASFVSSMNGTIISVAHNAINEDFKISDATFPDSYWSTTSWGLGGALFPLVLFPVMEDFGVRPVVLSTYFLCLCFLIPVGLAQNFVTIIVVRFFSGGCVEYIEQCRRRYYIKCL